MPASESFARSEAAVECVVPILRIRSLAASTDYYVRVLGFGLEPFAEWE